MKVKNLWLFAVLGACNLTSSVTGFGQATLSYSKMAPIGEYRIANREAEIAMARSAAPVAISGEAEVLVMGERGIETAVKGKNDFVCIVERSWAKDTDDAEFWNPKMRAPTCFNRAAAKAHLAVFEKKTEWVLAGLSKDQIGAKVKAGFASGVFTSPEPGAMAYMMSKDGYLSDADKHWHPHVMVYVAKADLPGWGANLEGSPVFGVHDAEEHATVFFIPVDHWSDGTTDAMKH